MKTQMSSRKVYFNLLIGAHIINDSSVDYQKWKMYVDIDESDDSRDVNVSSCIRDVKFTYRNQIENNLDQHNICKVRSQNLF